MSVRDIRLFYLCNAGEPAVFYHSTYIAFELEQFDFKTNEWRHAGD